MKLFLRYLWTKRRSLTAFVLFALVFAAVLGLYDLPALPVVYATLLCFLAGLGILIADYCSVRRKHRCLQTLKDMTAELIDELPKSAYITEEDYRELVTELLREHRAAEAEAARKYGDMVDYYTVWVHQIKTPIASMRLSLRKEDSEASRRLRNDLNRIEGYVNMVLTFLRLDSDSTDFVLGEYDLDGIVRSAVKKFSGDFIVKKLSLEYEPLNCRVLTDEKWLSFVAEQVISNAVKYTEKGSVSVYMEAPLTLCVRDTGIGIAPEDVPRVFENGYTGFNGRMDRRASGIGLYLCRRICGALGHEITLESEPGVGTTVRIALERKTVPVE